MAYQTTKSEGFEYRGEVYPPHYTCNACGSIGLEPDKIEHFKETCQYADLMDGFWKDYHARDEMPMDEFILLSDRDKSAHIEETQRQLGEIHKRWKTHLWMESMMKGGDKHG